MSLSIVTEGFMQGTLEQTEGGRSVNMKLNLAQPDNFYAYVLQQFKR
jgi:hypothetical protein